MYVHRFDRHVTLGVNVLVEKRFGSIAQSAADYFRTTDFHDSIVFISVKARGFRIQTNLTHDES